MKEIKTEIEINAPIDKVWKILIDVDSYPKWNPFITSLEGTIREGSIFKVTIHPPESKPMTFKPKCLSVIDNQEFIWLGHLIVPGIFDGKHIFELSELGSRTTRFVQREEFKGLLLPLLWKKLDVNTRKGFELMNEKLKEEAEK